MSKSCHALKAKVRREGEMKAAGQEHSVCVEQGSLGGASRCAFIDFSIVNPDLDFISRERRLTKAWQVLWSYFPPEGKTPFAFS